MNKSMIWKGLLLFVATGWVPAEVNAASLLEIYQQALQSDPLIHEAEARRLAALEAEPQARGVLFPQVDFDASWTESSTDGDGIQNTVVEEPPGSGNIVVIPIRFTTEIEDETKREAPQVSF